MKVFIHGVQYLFQEEVCFLQFIPEEEISLTEFKFVKIVALHQRYAEDIRRGKKPASARASLVGNRSTFEWYLDVEDLLVCNLSIS